MSEILRFLRQGKISVFLLLLASAVQTSALLGLLPPSETVARVIMRFFEEYGLLAVLAASFLENLVAFNLYFPGSIVLLTAMTLTAGSPARALATYGAVVGGSIGAHHVNYLFGRTNILGTLLSRATQSKTDSRYKNEHSPGWLGFFGAFWHPQFGSLVSTNAGATRMPYIAFLKYMLTAGISWSIFWALLLYHIGKKLNPESDLLLLVYAMMVIWVIVDFVNFHRDERSANHSASRESPER